MNRPASKKSGVARERGIRLAARRDVIPGLALEWTQSRKKILNSYEEWRLGKEREFGQHNRSVPPWLWFREQNGHSQNRSNANNALFLGLGGVQPWIVRVYQSHENECTRSGGTIISFFEVHRKKVPCKTDSQPPLTCHPLSNLSTSKLGSLERESGKTHPSDQIVRNEKQCKARTRLSHTRACSANIPHPLDMDPHSHSLWLLDKDWLSIIDFQHHLCDFEFKKIMNITLRAYSFFSLSHMCTISKRKKSVFEDRGSFPSLQRLLSHKSYLHAPPSRSQ